MYHEDNPPFDLQLFADGLPEDGVPDPEDKLDPSTDPLPEDFVPEEFKDEEDPTVLKQKIADQEKLIANKEKRYRDVQSMSQKTKNRADSQAAAAEAHGLEFADDGSLVKKQYNVDKKPKMNDKELLELGGKDPISMVQKITRAAIREEMAAAKSETAKKELQTQQMADKGVVSSLEGYSPEVENKLLEIINSENLVWAKNPFSTAVFYLGDKALQDKLQEKKHIGAPDKGKERRAAIVARGGKLSSQELMEGESDDPEVDRRRYMKLSEKDLEKQVTAETIKRTGKPIVGK